MSKNKWLSASLGLNMVAWISLPFMSAAIEALIVTSMGFAGVFCLYKGIRAHEMAARSTN